MLNWFKAEPSCPVSDTEAEWISRRFNWLLAELGRDRLTSATTLLPTTDFFPSTYKATKGEISRLLKLLAEHMGINPSKVELAFYRDAESRTSGLYTAEEGRFTVWIELAGLNDPLGVVATLAHELGHVILLGENRINPDEDDHEPLTDLLTVFLGLGLLTANYAVVEANWIQGSYSGWSVGQRGYLSLRAYGYALSHYAIARSELSPAWLRYLRPDVRSACKQGIAYLNHVRSLSAA
ncbi:hypothetical protein Pla108_28270 [Botrimarina colliarenosi]|uniref:Uncharacterized protein n=1 Tax=Botrimarina colliarenosi TaxID=2528001 RepID=A0A5C6ACA3_9BACT|nr:hypothetical protein [Botrimarina colliarenosi]TWT97050.1 hypothetical protein Pla108_28270 [Botrimarina colliarenosi]